MCVGCITSKLHDVADCKWAIDWRILEISWTRQSCYQGEIYVMWTVHVIIMCESFVILFNIMVYLYSGATMIFLLLKQPIKHHLNHKNGPLFEKNKHSEGSDLFRLPSEIHCKSSLMHEQRYMWAVSVWETLEFSQYRAVLFSRQTAKDRLLKEPLCSYSAWIT